MEYKDLLLEKKRVDELYEVYIDDLHLKINSLEKEIEKLDKEIKNKNDELYNKEYIIEEQKKSIDLLDERVKFLESKLKLDKEAEHSHKIRKLKDAIYEVEDLFFRDSPKVLKLTLNGDKSSVVQDKLKVILENFDLSNKFLDLNEAYSLMIISFFYNMFEEIVTLHPYIKSLYVSETPESTLIKTLINDRSTNEGGIVIIPSTLYIHENKFNIKNISKNMINRLESILPEVFYNVYYKVEVSRRGICPIHKEQLKRADVYIRLFDNLKRERYLLVNGEVCSKCDFAYISQNKMDTLINNPYGYTLQSKDSSNKEVHKKDDNKDIILENYNMYLAYYKQGRYSNCADILLTLIDIKNLEHVLSESQKVTLILTACTLNIEDDILEKVLYLNNYENLPEGALIRRLVNGQACGLFLDVYEKKFKYIEESVKNEVLIRVKYIDEMIKKHLNISDGIYNNLNTEDELKRLGIKNK